MTEPQKMPVDFSPFSSKAEALLWIATNKGTDVAAACENWIDRGTGGNLMRQLSHLEFKTDMVDVTKNPLRAKIGGWGYTEAELERQYPPSLLTRIGRSLGFLKPASTEHRIGV